MRAVRIRTYVHDLMLSLHLASIMQRGAVGTFLRMTKQTLSSIVGLADAADESTEGLLALVPAAKFTWESTVSVLLMIFDSNEPVRHFLQSSVFLSKHLCLLIIRPTSQRVL